MHVQLLAIFDLALSISNVSTMHLHEGKITFLILDPIRCERKKLLVIIFDAVLEYIIKVLSM